MHKREIILAAVGFVMLASFFGCSESGSMIQRETLLDQNWGRSYETAKYNQTLNPDAGKNLDPVVGMDGVAAENTVNKYDDSFKDKKGKEVTNILKLPGMP